MVAFREEETTPAEEQALTPDSVEHETLPEGLAAETMSEETEAQEQEEAQEETSEPTEQTTATGEIVLKLEKTDVSSTVKGVSFELKLACDLRPEDVTWFTMDSEVAIVKNGVVTTVGPGKTRNIAQHGDQQAECIVRCNF